MFVSSPLVILLCESSRVNKSTSAVLFDLWYLPMFKQISIKQWKRRCILRFSGSAGHYIAVYFVFLALLASDCSWFYEGRNVHVYYITHNIRLLASKLQAITHSTTLHTQIDNITYNFSVKMISRLVSQRYNIAPRLFNKTSKLLTPCSG